METIVVRVTQFLRPHGRRQEVETDLPARCKEDYEEMLARGCRFEAEVLVGGSVHMTISSADEDLDGCLTPNGPAIQEGMVAMLDRKIWLAKLDAVEEG